MSQKIIKYFDPKTKRYEFATVKDIGDLSGLNTPRKDNIVEAINSLVADGIDFSEIESKFNKRISDSEMVLNQSIADSIRQNNENLTTVRQDVSAFNEKLQRQRQDLQEEIRDSEQRYANTLRENIQIISQSWEKNKNDLLHMAESSDNKILELKNKLSDTSETLRSIKEVSDNTSATLDTVKGVLLIGSEKNAIDSLNDSIRSQNLSIQANSEGLKLKADASEVGISNIRIQSLESQFNLMNGELSNKITSRELQTAIEASEEYRTNLLKGSRDFSGWESANPSGLFLTTEYFHDAKVLRIDRDTSYKMYRIEGLLIGKTYTASIFAKVSREDSSVREKIQLVVDGRNNIMLDKQGDSLLSNEFKRFSIQFVAKRDNATISFRANGLRSNNQLFISAPKVEIGETFTKWQVNPDDTTSDIIRETKTKFEQLNGRITSEISTAKEEIVRVVDGKISPITSDLGTFGTRVGAIENVAETARNNANNALSLVGDAKGEFSNFIEGRFKLVEDKYNEWTTSEDGIIGTVSKIMRLDELPQDDGLIQKLGSVIEQKATQLKLTPDEIVLQAQKVVDKKIDSLNIGAMNKILNGNFEQGIQNWNYTKRPSLTFEVGEFTQGKCLVFGSNNIGGNAQTLTIYSNEFPFERDKTLQCGFEYIVSGTTVENHTKFFGIDILDIGGRTIYSKDFSFEDVSITNLIQGNRKKCTFSIWREALKVGAKARMKFFLRGKAVKLTNIYVHEGDVNLGYTPNEKDYVGYTNQIGSSIRTTIEGIEAKVVNKDGIVQSINATGEQLKIDWSKVNVTGAFNVQNGFTISNGEDMIFGVNPNTGRVEMNVSEMTIRTINNLNIDDIKGAIKSIKDQSEYISFIDNNVVVGNRDTGNYVRTTSSSLDFCEHDRIIAYISQGELNINKAVLHKQLRVGDFTLSENVIDGHTHLTWNYISPKKVSRPRLPPFPLPRR